MTNLYATEIRGKLYAGSYDARITNHQAVSNEKGGFIILDIQLPDREIQQCFFPNNLNYLGGGLRQQLNVPNEKICTIKDLLDLSLGKKLKVYITYTEYNGKSQMNMSFYLPKEKSEVGFTNE